MRLVIFWLMTSAYSKGFVARALQYYRRTLRAVNSFSTPKPRSNENRPIWANDDIPHLTLEFSHQPHRATLKTSVAVVESPSVQIITQKV